MTCSTWEERIALRAGGDLAPDESAELEKHLSECVGCREIAESFERNWAMLREAHAESAPEAALASVRARVLGKIEGRRQVWRWAWAGALAATAVAAAFIVRPVHKPVPVVAVVKPAVGQAGVPTVSVGPPVVVSGGVMPEKRSKKADREVRPTNSAPVGLAAQDTPKVETTLDSAGVDARATEATDAVAAHATPPTMVKLYTGDPNVIIYWIMESTGD